MFCLKLPTAGRVCAPYKTHRLIINYIKFYAAILQNYWMSQQSQQQRRGSNFAVRSLWQNISVYSLKNNT